MSFTIAESIMQASQILRKAGVPESRREAEDLLAHVIEKNRTFLITHSDDKLDPDQLENFRQYVERRAGGEPLQYITGKQDFYGREFLVTPNVLIPRPETELLVETALQLMPAAASFCDVGTGSGCIAITLLCESLSSQGVAVDISDAALDIANQNASEMNVTNRITFQVSDCFEGLDSHLAAFDLIVSNPPYVSVDALDGLQREVKDHEPIVALTPGSDGLRIIRRLVAESSEYLRKDGYLMVEIGFDQAESVKGLVTEPWELVEIRPDLAGIPRIVVLKKTR